MRNTPVRTIDPIFNAKDKVVLRFNKHDARIARGWQDSANNDKRVVGPSLAPL